ncbi:hypothetical protein DPMN_149815 [Dreissena polymorpha]|uniref:Uncharacterized protein n=1 Tax=Dreissena polymorpha TaxID=45954 RepID=A0A9D4FI41_DREPO|nr:hypothetical protein DPMN_149815 [Dreissena polymorpha]
MLFYCGLLPAKRTPNEAAHYSLIEQLLFNSQKLTSVRAGGGGERERGYNKFKKNGGGGGDIICLKKIGGGGGGYNRGYNVGGGVRGGYNRGYNMLKKIGEGGIMWVGVIGGLMWGAWVEVVAAEAAVLFEVIPGKKDNEETATHRDN